jgi:hypothetical protein
MTLWMKLTGESPVQLVRIRDNYFGYADLSDGFLRLIIIDQGFEADFFTIADAILAGGGVFLTLAPTMAFSVSVLLAGTERASFFTCSSPIPCWRSP